ncbi:MAG TPA: hypothetical protein VMZ71_03390 [Gemmataceae bacterium]|nr:hypothetical protein [Gemmataceae bacterium]
MRTLALPLLFALTLPVSASSPDPKRLAVPPEDTLKAQGLVRQLASDEFTVREEAQERLAKMGRLAKPVLSSAIATNPDPEVRSRCRELLPKAAAEDLKARLDTFLADAEGKYEHDLPGWNEFKKVTGSNPGVRALFNEMMTDQTNRSLLMAFGGSGADVGVLVAARKTELYNWRFPRNVGLVPAGAGTGVAPRRDPTPADITALLFAESFVESHQVPRTIAVSTLFLTPGFNAAAGENSERGTAIKAVIVKWLETRTDPAQMYQAMTSATNLGLKEASGVAAKLLQSGGTPVYRLYAAYAIAKNDAKQYAAALEKALDDTSAITSTRIVNGERFTTDYQVRDAALAALVMMSGQNTEDYGFVEQFLGNTTASRYTYSARTLAESERKAAVEKWRAWRAKNPEWGKEQGKK